MSMMTMVTKSTLQLQLMPRMKWVVVVVVVVVVGVVVVVVVAVVDAFVVELGAMRMMIAMVKVMAYPSLSH